MGGSVDSLQKGQKLVLTRNASVISVPFGKTIELAEGTPVEVMQARGSSVSIAAEGRLYLVEGDPLDVLGLDRLPRKTLPVGASHEALEVFVWDCLRTCFDPEVAVNIVELGLVYGVRLDTLITGETMVNVRMTLTAPGCGMGDVIAADARYKIQGAEQVSKVHVEIVFDPPWSRDMMSDEARLELGMF